MKISLCVITLNEEANLERCLRSCREAADEIVIVDSGSSDGTERIAKAYGARFVHQDWLGFVQQKNRALELATHDWGLSLDADEELSAYLQGEIAALRTVSKPKSEIGGFSMPRCVFYEGRWIRHGDWYPDRLVRLFRRANARFEGGRVHERLEVHGEIEPLNGEIYHYSFRDAADHWARCQHYAGLWAQSRFETGNRASTLAPWLHAGHRWLKGYLWRRGFLDGRLGWRIAAYSAQEAWLKYDRLRKLNRSASAGPQSAGGDRRSGTADRTSADGRRPSDDR